MLEMCSNNHDEIVYDAGRHGRGACPLCDEIAVTEDMQGKIEELEEENYELHIKLEQQEEDIKTVGE